MQVGVGGIVMLAGAVLLFAPASRAAWATTRRHSLSSAWMSASSLAAEDWVSTM